MKKCLLVFFTSVLSVAAANATTHTIVNAGFTFSPDTLTIQPGDTVIWNIASMHNVREVSQSDWLAGNNTPLAGGFSCNFGGGTVIFNTQSPGTYYYVCEPHAASGMRAVIIVSTTAAIEENEAQIQLSVFPNPAAEVIMVQSQFQSPGNVQYAIYTLSGKLVKANTFTVGAGTQQNAINIGSLQNGFYVLRVSKGLHSKAIRFVKQ